MSRHAVILAEAARLLGLDDATVSLLVRGGVLVAAPKRKGVRLVRWDDLVACARHRRYALALYITGRTTTDPLLREYARLAAGCNRWWGASDLAEACTITANTVRWRRKRGWGGAGWERWGAHWCWWGPTPPPWPLRELDGVRYWDLHEQLGSWIAVAGVAGKSPNAVRAAAYYARRSS
jgi:hypothetical protein